VAAEIPHVNWAFFTLDQKFDMMHAMSGSAAVEPASRALGILAPAFAESGDNIQAALRGTGVQWRGRAATAFTATMLQAADWAQRTGQIGKVGGAQVGSYGSSFDSARSQIPSKDESGANSFLGELADNTGQALQDSFGSTFGVQSDYAKRVAKYRALDAVANQALAAHETLTRHAVASFPDTQLAPAVTSPAATSSLSSHGPGGAGHIGGGTEASGPGPSVGGTRAGGAPAGTGAPIDGTGHAGTGHGGTGHGGTGRGGTGRGGTGRGGTGRGGTGHDGAGHPFGSTPTNSAGWTPIAPPGGTGGLSGTGSPVAAPDVGGPGLAPPLGPLPGGGTSWQPSRLGADAAGGSVLSPRGAAEPAGRPGLGAPGFGAGEPAGGRGMGGPGGMPPIGGAGAGARGDGREHRNNVFIPSDEPFTVHHDDVVPAVLGTPGAEL